MIHVETLQKTPDGVRAFLALPKRLYRKDPYWVPPMKRMELHHLIGVHNPWRNGPHALFLAYDDERPVARVLAGVDQRINDRLQQKRGYIALFESEDNMEYARAVLDAAAHYLKAQGMEAVIGPSEPGFDDYTEGLLYEGFDSLNSLFNPYNPPYYDHFFTEFGFSKYRDHRAYLLKTSEFPASSYEKLSDMAQKRFGFRVAAADLRPDNQEALARDVANMIAKALPSDSEVIPPTIDDTLYELKSIIRYTKADLPVTAYAGDRLVGVAVAFSDYSSLAKAINGRLFPIGWVARIFHKIRTARCSMVFVAPDFHNKAVNAAMMLRMVQHAKELGIQAFEISAIDETNLQSALSLERAGAKHYRTYRQYQMKL
jgi:GNAT superfamily N-acetyltransferase